MKSDDLRNLMREAGVGGSSDEPADPVAVFVELAKADAGSECISRLRSLGLEVGRVIGNKITGTVDSKNIEKLREDSEVRLVEVSKQLRPHAR